MIEPNDQNLQKSGKATLDDLAVMIKNGFDNAATKQDIKALDGRLTGAEQSLKADLDKIDERLQVVEAKLDRAL